MRLLLILTIALICPDPAAAQPSPETPDATRSVLPAELQPMVVVASKSPRPVQDVAGTVHLITSEDRERLIAQDLDQMLRYLPAVNAERSGTRFGLTGINIRGIGGNRVALEVDGVPMRDQFAVGSFSNAGRDLIENHLIRRIEILNGPASTLYGSDAVGGVLAISTWDAASLLAGSRDDWYAAISGSYQGADSSEVVTITTAAEQAGFGLVASATRRTGEQLENQSDSGLLDDLQDRESISGFARFDWRQGNGNQWRFTVNHLRRDTQTRIASLLGTGRFRTTTALLGDDCDEQTQAAVNYSLAVLPGFDEARLLIYYQTSDTFQRSSETRDLANPPLQLRRDFRYQQRSAGAELDLESSHVLGAGRHRLGLGLEYRYTRINELRDASQTDLITGQVSNRVLGEVFPVRDFPVSDISEWGLHVHDEIRFADYSWSLIPAVRLDHYRLRPDPDNIYLEDNPLSPAVSVSSLALSPKLGLVYPFADHWSGFAQYARGFRAPPFADANIGLDIPLFGIRALPNPDLQSEKSHGVELGIRRWAPGGQFSLSGFYTRYDDFIESRARIGIEPVSGVLLFQSRNIERARIYGAELSWTQKLETWHGGLRGWQWHTAAYWSRGDNLVSRQPLNSIAPPQAVVGLQWESADGRWYSGLTGTLTRRQDRIDTSEGERFVTPGYVLLDWLWGWRAASWLQVRGGVFNVTDKKYWRWLDVAAFAPDDSVIEVLSRPGRHLALNLSIEL